MPLLVVRHVSIDGFEGLVAALACDSTTAEGRAVARLGHIGHWSQELGATAGVSAGPSRRCWRLSGLILGEYDIHPLVSSHV